MAAVLRRTADELRHCGIAEFSQEARLLVAHVLGFSSADLISQSSKLIENELLVSLDALIARRKNGEPVFRIIGKREFYGLDFEISKDVLEPRPDTETLVDQVLEDFSSNACDDLRILDIGTGSGAIIISLLRNLPKAKGLASDISSLALGVAKKNAKLNGVEKRVAFVQANWCEGIAGRFDIIVSNPPYIGSEVIETLAGEVKNHDPRVALDGGADGLDAYRHILAQTPLIMNKSGKLYLEIGYDQVESVVVLAKKYAWRHLQTIKDMGGHERVVVFSVYQFEH